jgi:hypothetical protein
MTEVTAEINVGGGGQSVPDKLIFTFASTPKIDMR